MLVVSHMKVACMLFSYECLDCLLVRSGHPLQLTSEVVVMYVEVVTWP